MKILLLALLGRLGRWLPQRASWQMLLPACRRLCLGRTWPSILLPGTVRISTTGYVLFNQMGPYAQQVYWAPFVTGVVLPQLWGFRKLSRSMIVLFPVTCILPGVVPVNSIMKSWQI